MNLQFPYFAQYIALSIVGLIAYRVLILVAVALAISDVILYPLLKFGLLALITVPLIFGLSSLIRRLPNTQRVL